LKWNQQAGLEPHFQNNICSPHVYHHSTQAIQTCKPLTVLQWTNQNSQGNRAISCWYPPSPPGQLVTQRCQPLVAVASHYLIFPTSCTQGHCPPTRQPTKQLFSSLLLPPLKAVHYPLSCGTLLLLPPQTSQIHHRQPKVRGYILVP
jgi:hypothetical protein